MAHPAAARASAPRLGNQFVTLVFALAVATLPLGHDDLACHLTSTTHCASCTIGLDDVDATAGGPAAVTLQPAGATWPDVDPGVPEPRPRHVSGRSPPRI